MPSTGPLANGPDEATAETLRARRQAVVDSINNPRCVFIKIATAFDRTSPAIFRVGPPAPILPCIIHWNTAGHGTVADVATAALTARGWCPAHG